jgi:hypothetical protein
MTTEPTELDLWELSDSRRIELGKRWKDVLAETGLSHETLNRWRKGFKVDNFTDRSFEKALQWGPGAREAIAANRKPMTLDAAEPTAPTANETPALSSQELEILQDLVVSTATRLGLSPEETDEAYRRARAELERRRTEAGEQSSQPPRRRRAG